MKMLGAAHHNRFAGGSHSVQATWSAGFQATLAFGFTMPTVLFKLEVAETVGRASILLGVVRPVDQAGKRLGKVSVCWYMRSIAALHHLAGRTVDSPVAGRSVAGDEHPHSLGG